MRRRWGWGWGNETDETSEMFARISRAGVRVAVTTFFFVVLHMCVILVQYIVTMQVLMQIFHKWGRTSTHHHTGTRRT